MAEVQTIAGPVDSTELGPTLSHEHLCSGMAGMERLGLFDIDDAARRAAEALQQAYDVGIRTVIDCTPVDLGRQIEVFQRVADRSPVHVIAATGVYRSVPLPYYAWDADTVAAYFLREIQDGIEGSGIRAGIIKLAWDIEYQLQDGPRSPRAQLEKCARGAARAARAAGVPITCHTRAADRHGDRLLDIFEEEGLDLRAVTIGHTNDARDLDYVLGLARRGATVGLDRFIRVDEAEAARRAGIALALAQAGYADQTSLGHDLAAYSLNMGPATGGAREEDPGCWRKVSEVEIPWLRTHGVTATQVDAMLTDSVRATMTAAAAMASRG